MRSGYLYCIRVLTCGVFKQIFYEKRVFGESLHGRWYQVLQFQSSTQRVAADILQSYT